MTKLKVVGIRAQDSIFEELDSEITEDEVKKAISRLSRNKSSGEDLILNELF